MFYNIRIYKNSHGYYNIVKSRLKFKDDIHYGARKIYHEKLNNSISRARSRVFEYVMNNDFYYYVTLTLNRNNNRFDLDTARKKISNIIRYLRKKGLTNLEYILIPELHKDGAIHFHGFFTSGFGEDFYINKYGFLSWSSYDKIGFSNISKIRNYKRCACYITKYINKDICSRNKGSYIYFHSQGLSSNKPLCDITTCGLLPYRFDFENCFISKRLLNYDNFVTFIDYLKNSNKIYSYSKCNKQEIN